MSATSDPTDPTVPTSAIDLVLPLDVHKLILDELFRVNEPLGPQSTIVSPDKGAAHLLRVSKAFSELVLPRMWRMVAIHKTDDWMTLFGTDTGVLVGDSEAAKVRRGLVKTLLVDFSVYPPFEKDGRRANQLFRSLAFPKSFPFLKLISLSPIKDVDDSTERLAAIVASAVSRTFQWRQAEDGGVTDADTLRAQVMYETQLELGIGAYAEAEDNRLDLLRSGRAYILEAEIGDEMNARFLTNPTQNTFGESMLSNLRDRRSILHLSPGMTIAEDDEDGRGYVSLDKHVREPVKKLLRKSKLPRVRLVGFPSTWPDEFVEWSDQPDVRLGKSRGVEWVMEDGSIVPFMPDDEPNASETPVATNAWFAAMVGNLLGSMQNVDFNALFNPTQAT